MTAVRMELYEKYPELARENYDRMVQARRKKLENDPEFRDATLERLALGPDALW